MLPSNFAASGLPIKVSKAGLDACGGLSVDAWAECSAHTPPSPSVAACCDVACRRLLLPLGNASARRESSATSEFSSSILIAFERTFSAKRSEEHTSELQSHSELVCRLLLEKKKTTGSQ